MGSFVGGVSAYALGFVLARSGMSHVRLVPAFAAVIQKQISVGRGVARLVAALVGGVELLTGTLILTTGLLSNAPARGLELALIAGVTVMCGFGLWGMFLYLARAGAPCGCDPSMSSIVSLWVPIRASLLAGLGVAALTGLEHVPPASTSTTFLVTVAAGLTVAILLLDVDQWLGDSGPQMKMKEPGHVV